MQAVFNLPMVSDQFHEAGGTGPVGGKAGDAVYDFESFFIRGENGGMAVKAKNLGGMGKIEIAGQFGAGPDGPFFQAAVLLIESFGLWGGKAPRPRSAMSWDSVG